MKTAVDGIVLDVPDKVWVSFSGKVYYPRPNRKGKIEVTLQQAIDEGYVPSEMYNNFLKQLIEKQKSDE